MSGLRWPKVPKRLQGQVNEKLGYVPKARSRFGVSSCWYNQSCYDSRAEARYARDLDLRLQAGDIRAWSKQVKIDIRVNGIHITNYYVDFKVEHNDGRIEWVEVKGPETALWKIKRRLFEAVYHQAHPEERYTIERA